MLNVLPIYTRLHMESQLQQEFSMNGYTNRFSHVQVHSSCPIGKCPIKVVQKLCQNKHKCGYGKGNSSATHPTRSKWDQLEIISFKVYKEDKNLLG